MHLGIKPTDVEPGDNPRSLRFPRVDSKPVTRGSIKDVCEILVQFINDSIYLAEFSIYINDEVVRIEVVLAMHKYRGKPLM